MMILPLLPIGRQLKSTCQQIFAGLRATARSLRLLDNTLPRLRLRSLDIIPLSLSLPRNISIMELTRQLDSSVSLDVWLQLEFGSTFASEIFRRLIPFFASSSDSSPPTLPPLMTWNSSSLAAIHSQPSPKINHILKLAKSHICFVQETRWTSVQFNYLLGRAPFCHIAHTPATSTGSSGVATFFPRRITPTSSTTIAPGFILSSKFSLQGYQCEVLNVYLHPDKVHSLASILLKHLKSADSRKNVVRIVGGDFNKLPSRAPDLFNSILVELDCSSPPMQNSYRQRNGYQAPLDFFLLQTPANFHQLLSSSKRFTFWPKYQPVGHGIHICKFPRITPITSSSDDLPAPTIPTSAFYLPLLPRSSLTHILHLICNPSFAPYCPYLLLLYCLSKPPFGLDGVTPLVPINLFPIPITTTCYNAKSAIPNLSNASSLVFLGNGCFLIFHLPLHRILSFMTLLCLSPSSCCLLFSHNTTYYSLLLTDPFRGLSSLLLPLIPGTNVATLLLKLHAIPVSFALTPVTSVKLLQT